MIHKLLIGLQFLGVRVTLQSVLYALTRDRWRRPAPLAPPGESPIGDWIRQRKIEQGMEVIFQNAVLTIEVLADDLVRLAWSPGLRSPEYACVERRWPPVRVSIDHADGLRLATSQLRIDMTPTGRIILLNEAGRRLFAFEAPRLFGEGWRVRAPLAHEECLFGLGERAAGLNLRPGRYRLWNRDPGGGYTRGHDPLYMTIPVLAGLHAEGSYLIFFDNPHDGWVELGDQADIEFEAGQLVAYFVPGPLDRALARYLELTGRPPLPPQWSLGLHQSRWGYRTQAQVLEVLQGYRNHQLPLSALHLDIDHLDDYKSFTFDPRRFPEPAGLATQLHADGTRLVVMVEPGVKLARGYRAYEQGLSAGHLCRLPDGRVFRGLVWPGWVGFPDFTSPPARHWWGSQYRALLDLGIDGFWHDMNEPTCFAAWGETTFPDRVQHDLDGVKGDHRSAHNLYALEMNRAAYEWLRVNHPERRPFLLTRSGWAGVQRYAWHWTGDTLSTWESLGLTIPSVLGLTLSGILLSGPDIGGFNGHPDPELYVRWFELSALLPFFRVHSAATAPPREPWRFGPAVTGHVRRLLELRQRLMPYLYTLAAEAAESGSPMVRPAFWFDPADPLLWTREDCFALGPSLLAAPVLSPGVTSRHVRLPAGEWFDYWTGDHIGGGRTVEVDAPLGRPPLFLRAGAILPEDHEGQLTLTLALPGKEPAAANVYTDAGDGYGAFRWDRFEIQSAGADWRLNHASRGEFPAGPVAVALRLPGGGGRISGLVVDGVPAAPQALPPGFRQATFRLATS